MSQAVSERSFNGLPGAELVETGLADLRRGAESPEALLVSIAAPRLQGCGLHVPEARPQDPNRRLMELLTRESGDAGHAQYNALLGRMASFCRAVERARTR